VRAVLERQVSLEEGGREEWLVDNLGIPRYIQIVFKLLPVFYIPIPCVSSRSIV
jgi:hypothetical protein